MLLLRVCKGGKIQEVHAECKYAWLQNVTMKRVNINSKWSAFNCFINRSKRCFFFILKSFWILCFMLKNICHQKIPIITYECWERKALIPIVEQIGSIHNCAQGLIFVYTSWGLGSWLPNDQRRDELWKQSFLLWGRRTEVKLREEKLENKR